MIDLFFFLDMCIIFNSAVLTDEFETIDDRKEIACIYLKSWFCIDLLSILPFEVMIRLNKEEANVANINQMLRILRIGKLTKLFKLMKLLRILKIL